MGKDNKSIRLDKGIERGEPVQIFVDGAPVTAYKGETIATAMMGAGLMVSRTIDNKPLGVHCNIGVCHSCVMTVDGVSSVRICKTPVTEGCRIETQHYSEGTES